MNDLKQNYKFAMEFTRKQLPKPYYEYIVKYVDKLERENYGLKTTVENLKRKVAKDYECIPYR